MNRVIFKLATLVLCSAIAISAQQAEQGLPQVQHQQEQQIQQQVQQPQPQVQQPQVQVQQPQPQAQVQLPPLQQQVRQPQTDCPQPLTQPRWGLWTKFNLNSVSYGFNSKKNDGIDMGIGFGGGVVRRIPITSSLDITPEIGLLHRNLYGWKSDISDPNTGKTEEYLEDESEFVLSIVPVLTQFTPFEFPLYVAAGIQVDFPILAKLTTTIGSNEETKTYSRAGYDLGVIWGIGYNIAERFSFNFRSVIGLRSITGKRADSRTLTQYGLGVVFF